MTALKKTLVTAASAAMFTLGTAAHAGVVIDLFDDSPQQVVATTSLFGPSNSQFYNPSTLGEYRDAYIKRVAGGGSSYAAIGKDDDGVNTLTVNNGSGVTSEVYITWDGASVVGSNPSNVNKTGLGADLTYGGADAFLANVLRADLGFEYAITIWDMDGDVSKLSAGVQFQFPVTNPASPVYGLTVYPATYQYDWFNYATGSGYLSYDGLNFDIDRTGGTGDGVLDFTKIGAIQLKLSAAGQSADFALGSVSTIPEPGALALVGAALFGMAAVGRRRKA